MDKYVLIALLSGVISAGAQMLLKKSSQIERKSFIREYCNFYVIGGYGLTALCMILMVLAYKGLPFKYGAVLEALVYFYVMLLSRFIFGEQLTRGRIVGNLFIVAGVAIFSMG